MFTIALTTAQQALVMAHLFVADIAVRLYIRGTNRRYIFAELLSSAYLGLCDAAQAFDELRISERTGLPVKFTSNALKCCKNQIKKDVNNDRTIRVPLHHFKGQDKRWKTKRYVADAQRAISMTRRSTETLDELEWRR